MYFHYRGMECKSRKSRNAQNNRQIWPWNTEWSRAKTNRVLPRKCTGHSKHSLPTTQEKTLHMDITRWSTPKSDWLYSLQPKMEKLHTVNKTRLGADCGFSIFGCKEYNQSDFGIDHLMMSMCRVFSCVVGRGCLLWPVHSLGKTLLAFALLHSVLQGQICLLLQVFLDFLLLHSSPL